MTYASRNERRTRQQALQRTRSPLRARHYLCLAVGKLRAVRGVHFHWRRGEFPERQFAEGRHVGFIAQEVEAVMPEVVKTQPDGYKTVAYSNILPYVVEATKAHDEQISELRKAHGEQIRELRQAMAHQQRQIAELDGALAAVLTELLEMKAMKGSSVTMDAAVQEG